jgi:sugar lactone lactonase YvrE
VIAELTEDTRAALGEGPTLFPDGSLYWVDLVAGEVFRRDSKGSVRVQTFPYDVSKVLPWNRGFLALTRAGVEAFTGDGEAAFTIDLTDSDDSLRCSDATVLPGGGIAVGVMDRDMAPERGRLVVIHPGGDIETVVSTATIPNGIDVLASGRDVVWVDSPTQTLMRFTIDPTTGTLHSPQEWATIPPALGVPDGLCADSRGGVWVALWGGGTVVHITADGDIDAAITVGVDHVTSVAFDSADTLIITTGNVILSDEERARTPSAGGIFSVPNSIHKTHGLPPRIATLSPRVTSHDSQLTISPQLHHTPPHPITLKEGGAPEEPSWKERL